MQAVKPAAVPKALPAQTRPVVELVTDPQDSFARLLKGVDKNSPMPELPQRVNIVGMNGQIVELDPRRVRPLPENPRHADNPGFTTESLTELGESIQAVGQLEEGLVCPITDDPRYDAQLIDAERRIRSCLIARLMFRAKVREDVTPMMVRQLYLLSLIRNVSKVELTTLESIDAVIKLRGPEYNMTQKEIAQALSTSVQTVQTYEKLSRLHPQVLAMVGDNSGESRRRHIQGTKGIRKLTSQLGLLLLGMSPEQQLTEAKRIIVEDMTYNQARRYILNVQRELLGHTPKKGKNRSAARFGAMRSLARRNADAIGEYNDMSNVELDSILMNRTEEEVDALLQELDELCNALVVLKQKIRPT